MPVNSLLGQRAVVIDVVALARYDFSDADTYAMCSAIPAGGTTLQLPATPNPGDAYAWADADNTCAAGKPMIIVPDPGGTAKVAQLASISFTTPGASGFAVFDSQTNNWVVFGFSAGGGGGGGAALLGTYTIAVGAVAVGQAVKISAADTAALAQANAAGNAAIGVVRAIVNPTEIEVTYAGEQTGFVGLVTGSTYYLDPATPGALTVTAPVTPGQVVQRLGKAKDPTTLVVSVAGFVQL